MKGESQLGARDGTRPTLAGTRAPAGKTRVDPAPTVYVPGRSVSCAPVSGRPPSVPVTVTGVLREIVNCRFSGTLTLVVRAKSGVRSGARFSSDPWPTAMIRMIVGIPIAQSF